MPQLPSVSEILIGAQNSSNTEVRPGPQPPAHGFRTSPLAAVAPSETSPRQTEFVLGPPPAVPAAGVSAAARHMRVPSTSHNYADGIHGAAPESHLHALPGSTKDAFAPSSASSGRNSISSSVLEHGHGHTHGHAPHGQTHAPVFAPDYFSYRDGQRSRHASSQSSSPHLQYKPRQGSSAGLHTRATSYQSVPSQESLVRTHSRSPGVDKSPTFYARPRPASFSHASGPGVAYAPMGPTIGPGMGAAQGQYSTQMPVMYHQQVSPGAPGAGAVVPPPLAYYNSATAGSGFPGGGFHGGQDANAAFHAGAQANPRTVGSYGANYGQAHFAPPHPQAQFHLPGMPAPAPAPAPTHIPLYQMEGMAPGQGMVPRQAHYHFVPPGASEMPPSADPNHALINKRCIIKRRTRTGCLTCRKRRIKCDERKPHCFNCERSKKLCLGYEASPSKSGQSRKSSECSPASSPADAEETSDIVHGQPASASGGPPTVPVVKQMPRVSVHDLI